MSRSGVNEPMSFTNFGGNISFAPKYRYTPETESELLELLNTHAEGRVRVVGSLHSWSDVIASQDVVVDMRNFNYVDVTETGDGAAIVKCGGGSLLKDLIKCIEGKTNCTFPTLGGVLEQTIAGAISTGTHGSGAHSLSHYIEELRMAAYDPDTGKAKIYEWRDGLELLAARCGLGCMGIILSVRFRCVPKYDVEEIVVREESLEGVLAREREFPLQQFVLVPYLWSFFAYRRRATTRKPSWIGAVRTLMARAYNLIAVDILFHIGVKALTSPLGGPSIVRWFYKHMYPRIVMQGRSVVDDATHVLTLNHHYFKHIEMEISVPARNVHKATALVRHIVCVFAGTLDADDNTAIAELGSIDTLGTLTDQKGTYTHHYPIVFRRVLQDDTLVSMASGPDAPYYAISIFTYRRPSREFHEFARFLARTLSSLCNARPHWGKYLPLDNNDIEPLYPHLEQFRQTCRVTDPAGVFRNEYTERVLGFKS